MQLALKVIGRRSAPQRRVEAAWPNPPDTTTRWPFDPDFKRLPDEPGDAATRFEQIETFRAGLEAWKTSCESYRGYRLDLHGANLQGADMAARQPDGSDAVFSGSHLVGVRLEGAALYGARMESAHLFSARMEGARLYEAQLEGVNLDEAKIEGAGLDHARMEGSSLHHAQMQAASLYEARMEGADVQWAQMEGVRLIRARMEGAHIESARMDGTSLGSAHLFGAGFNGIDLRSVDGLTEKQLYAAFGDGSVILPEGMDPPTHWPKKKLGWVSFHAELDKWRASPSTYTPPQGG